MKPTPVSVLPDRARPVIAWMPGPVRPCPAGVAAVQAEPFADVHTTTSWWPGVLPNIPVAVKPPPAAASAVTEGLGSSPAGTGSAASVQLAPPSDEFAANGSRWPAVVTAVPTATTVRPLLATCCNTALVDPIGTGRSAWRQVRPSGEIQAEAWLPSEPTATKPPERAATASICLLAPDPAAPSRAPAAASVARSQSVRPADHQAAAMVRSELA